MLAKIRGKRTRPSAFHRNQSASCKTPKGKPHEPDGDAALNTETCAVCKVASLVHRLSWRIENLELRIKNLERKLLAELSSEETVMLQTLYTETTRGRSIPDDMMTPPERRVLRKLEEKGFVRCTVVTDNGLRRAFWELTIAGKNLVENPF